MNIIVCRKNTKIIAANDFDIHVYAQKNQAWGYNLNHD
jgi:hypothetical protein